jgi:short-subunit dehydrogenase
LGEEYATQLARRGLNLVAIARREDLLTALAARLTEAHGVRVVPLALDLASQNVGKVVARATHDLEVGLLVYNAGLSVIGPFLERSLEDHLREIDVNCRGPLVLAHLLGQRMVARHRGGVILMSSLSATMGSALIANYAATKAYNMVLAEGLWEELREAGITVMAVAAGAISTPNYRASGVRTRQATQTPEAVVTETLGRLGSTPQVIPGFSNRLSAFALRRLMPRAATIRLMGRVLRGMYGSA